MPTHHFEPPRGRIETLTIDSDALRGNLLGDPTERTIAVYLPEGYDDSSEDYPLLVGLAGFTGSGLKLLSWQAFGESVPQRIDRLLTEGAMGPVILALPDCFTSLGGNQYVDSVALGHWERFLLDEMLPRLEASYRVRPGAAHRAVFGKSSGGYGSIIQGLKHGDRWGAVACHSGDMGFDSLYRRDLAPACDVLAKHDRDVSKFMQHLRSAPKLRGDDLHAMMLLVAMAASYDPDPEAPYGVRLPVDPYTCELIPERWERWLEHDPLRLIEQPQCQESLRRLRGLFIDVGEHDQYFIHYPARSFSRKLNALGIEHTYEEFDDDHSSVDYRMDRSLPYLYDAIQAT